VQHNKRSETDDKQNESKILYTHSVIQFRNLSKDS
jgi:hypothetical protein